MILSEQTISDYWQFAPNEKPPEWVERLIHAGQVMIVNNAHKEKRYLVLFNERCPNEGVRAFVGDYICAEERAGEDVGIFVTSRASFERRRKP